MPRWELYLKMQEEMRKRVTEGVKEKMTFEQFQMFQDKLFQECREMSGTKGKEYAHDADRFANFNRLAQELEIKPELVAWIFTKKHLDAIVSYVKEGKTFSNEAIRGRFVDAIVYLTLIAGMTTPGGNSK